MGIFNVHNLVTDIVGGLGQKDKRMARKARSLGGFFYHFKAQFARYGAEVGALALEKAKLVLTPAERGGIRILHNGRQRAIGHDEAAAPMPVELVGEQAKRIGITVEMGEVGPNGWWQLRLQLLPTAFAEEAADSALATMSEGRIAHIVGQTGGTDNGSNVFHTRAGQIGMTL